jgi:hypothetical protein
VLFFVILVIALLHNAFYSQPMADDFWFSNVAFSADSWVDATLTWYRTWGGRYTAWALASIFSLNFDLVADYWVFCIGLILLTLFSFYFFFNSLGYIAGSRNDWLLWTLFSFCFYIALNPALPETIYWLAGGLSYTGGYCLFLVIAGLLIRLSFNLTTRLMIYVYSFICGVLVVTSAGLSEVVALLQLTTIGIGMIMVIIKRHPVRYAWILLFVLSLTSFVVVVAAPGNAIRAAEFEGGSVWVAPFYSLYQATGAIAGAFVVMFLATTNSAMFPLLKRLSGEMREKMKMISKKERLSFLLGIFLLYCAVYFPSYVATGGAPPHRTQVIFYILPLLAWIPCVGIIMMFENLWGQIEFWLNQHKAKLNFISALALVAVLAFMNVKDIFADFLWRAKNYNDQLTLRYSIIDNAKQNGNLIVAVPELRDVPKSMHFGDILSDSTHWRNQYYKEYFGLVSIKTKKE